MIDLIIWFVSEIVIYYVFNYSIGYLRWLIFSKKTLNEYLDDRYLNVMISQ